MQPGTIIVIENVLPDQSSLPRPRRGRLQPAIPGTAPPGSAAAPLPPKSKTPGAPGAPMGGPAGFSWHEELRKQKIELDAIMMKTVDLKRKGLLKQVQWCQI